MLVRLNTCHTPFSLVNTRTVRGCKRALESPTVSKSPSLRVRLNNATRSDSRGYKPPEDVMQCVIIIIYADITAPVLRQSARFTFTTC